MSAHPLPPSPAVTLPAPAGQGVQLSIDDLGTPLQEVTFVVFDLETTGTGTESEITEFGAVKVRGGEVLGEFQTLVRPTRGIPPRIQVLTGITTAMVVDAPPLADVLPSFLEFCGEAVLVAHNASFDTGFVRRACEATGRPHPTNPVVDTLRLARAVLPRGEVPNHRLATLAQHLGVTTPPDHRALHDARATVDLLHALVGRLGTLGVTSLEELQGVGRTVSESRRRKRTLADGLPHAPGVYRFEDHRGEVLYVGTAVDLRRRVAQYFTASEKRRRMEEMVRLAERCVPIVCETGLEAAVRELRLIAEHRPRYNRRDRNAGSQPYVKLTDEPFPRLSVVRSVREDGGTYIGPLPTTSAARQAVEALHSALRLRQCTPRITPASAARETTACLLADLGRCDAPCTGRISQEGYAAAAEEARRAMGADHRPAWRAISERLASLAADERYEEARILRDAARAWLRAADRRQRHTALARIPELVAARRLAAGGWELVCVRHGRLAGSAVAPRGTDPMLVAEALRSTAEVTAPGPQGSPACLPGEADLVLHWLEGPGVRLVHSQTGWAVPLHGPGRTLQRLEAALAAERSATEETD
ncbi:DNA polymerase-3 subunit epsilon [Kytococcus aerolatus]|uniref:DNA polymerase-3 subunit epsilon n=1 Tax=Kytococcus aerolatus TaxID=592308 RepID=A0A212T3W4_9MICO|nr:DEDD exonuclease domain-containing protein [Kytococcus aerolatus]SNC60718.1 DNA polymerase-3 subunit epsilon [Kytococcus aerolatus]